MLTRLKKVFGISDTQSASKIVINVEKLECRVAHMESSILEEYTIERTDADHLVGSIFKGRVKNIEQGLKAMFVDIGTEARGLIRDHIEAFGAGGVTKLLRRDATALGPAGTMGPMHLVFLDPPYGKSLGEKALVALRDGHWLAPEAKLVLEESADAVIDLPAGFALEDRRVYGAAAAHFLRFG